MFQQIAASIPGGSLPSASAPGEAAAIRKRVAAFFLPPTAQADLLREWSRADEYRRMRDEAIAHARHWKHARYSAAVELWVRTARYWNRRVLESREDAASPLAAVTGAR